MMDSVSVNRRLLKLLKENDRVFIVPHNRPDMDAIGASIGMALICKKHKKMCFIVIDDETEKLESATKKVINEIGNEFDIIRASEIPSLITKKSLMICVDVNKSNLISTKKYLDIFNDVFVLDHHKTDDNTIKTNHLFVDESLSSTCEEVSKLLFLNEVDFSMDHANYLLAGIILDTNRLSKNVSSETFNVASKLTDKGADAMVANNMFLEDFEHDRAIQRLVDNTIFPTYVFAIASDKEDSHKIYDVEDIAKASDYLLKYQVNATFAIAYIDEETISISARSKGIIDVSKIMAVFGGGGNEHSAAARIKDMSIEEVKSKLNSMIIPFNYTEEIVEKDKKLTLNLTK